MLDYKHPCFQEEQEIRLLKEWLPKISGECRAYIKGASQALFFTQEGAFELTAGIKTEEDILRFSNK